MTREQLKQTVYVVIDGEVEDMSYEDYLNEYGKDETTTPHGIGDRMHIREVEDDEGNAIEWQVWTWGVGGNHPAFSGTSFETEEEAEMYSFERKEWWIAEKNWDAPRWFDSEKEAEEDIIESYASNFGIDKEVAANIRRKEKIVNQIRANKAAAHRAKITAEYEARKAYLAEAVPAEAATITIDQQFVEDLKAITGKNGNEKANRHTAAFKALLQRNGKEKIESDFWQVFRILKSKSGI